MSILVVRHSEFKYLATSPPQSHPERLDGMVQFILGGSSGVNTQRLGNIYQSRDPCTGARVPQVDQMHWTCADTQTLKHSQVNVPKLQRYKQPGEPSGHSHRLPEKVSGTGLSPMIKRPVHSHKMDTFPTGRCDYGTAVWLWQVRFCYVLPNGQIECCMRRSEPSKWLMKKQTISVVLCCCYVQN